MKDYVGYVMLRLKTKYIFFFKCEILKETRDTLIREYEMTVLTDPYEKLQTLLENPYKLGNFIQTLWQKRNLIQPTVNNV